MILNRVLFRLYLKGYKGVLYPRWTRKLFAKTEMHRAWINGHIGIYIEAGIRHSVCDRDWYRYRTLNIGTYGSRNG